ncbi:MAG TPA: HAD-IA family hydrolase [Candidatus Sulfomarinibacteraceae bacterium]|nr:HAD-IA family hydrolase [Candidatus Sulfomarinibacteraceae bacterium]
MGYEAVIFDRDGVLIDFDLQAAAAFFRPLVSAPLSRLIELWQAYGQRVGFPRDLEEERAFWRGVWRYVAGELGLDPQMEDRLQQFDYTEILYAYGDALPALQLCRRRGLHTAVLSNFALASIEASLQATGLADAVDFAAAATVIGAAKPEPAAYEFVTDCLGVSPAACLLFDNKREHVAGARSLGMTAYVVDRRREDHDLAQGIVSDLSALEQILSRE